MREGILAQERLTLIKYIIMDVLLPNVNMPLTVKPILRIERSISSPH